MRAKGKELFFPEAIPEGKDLLTLGSKSLGQA